MASQAESLPPASAGFLLGLNFEPEDVGLYFTEMSGFLQTHRITTQKSVLFNDEDGNDILIFLSYM
jgi:hypothetical protein